MNVFNGIAANGAKGFDTLCGYEGHNAEATSVGYHRGFFIQIYFPEIADNEMNYVNVMINIMSHLVIFKKISELTNQPLRHFREVDMTI